MTEFVNVITNAIKDLPNELQLKIKTVLAGTSLTIPFWYVGIYLFAIEHRGNVAFLFALSVSLSLVWQGITSFVAYLTIEVRKQLKPELEFENTDVWYILQSIIMLSGVILSLYYCNQSRNFNALLIGASVAKFVECFSVVFFLAMVSTPEELKKEAGGE